MTIETMDLVYSRSVRYYEAPFQMKANGGTLVIDDFGRQRVDPLDLLNRWTWWSAAWISAGRKTRWRLFPGNCWSWPGIIILGDRVIPD